MNLIDAIYTRQSVDRADSISVESQAEFCKREVADADIKIYTDKGYSGKNVDRPAFQEMLADIEAGKIRRVIVYRLDRISRSVLDFANIIEVFQRHNVDFVSTMEKFDTGTPIGKAMLMIVMIFAQLERETIQLRVLDAYHSRSKRGFYMGGKVPYGFRLAETVIDGIRTKMYEPIPEETEIIREIFSMYAEPQVSFGDVARYLEERQVKKRDGSSFSRPRLRDLVVNPVYVQADYRIYEFFKAQDVNIINPPEDFIGTNGAYLYSGDKANKRKSVSLQGHALVLAPHEGIVDAEIWIKCRRKCLHNRQVSKPVKAKATWLAGKIRCAQCGYALSAKIYHCKTKSDNRYFLCTHNPNTSRCHFGSLNADFVEETVFEELSAKLEEFQTISRQRQEKFDLQTIKLKSRIEKIDQEIAGLLDKVVQANASVMEYINNHIAALDAEKKERYAEVVQLSEATGQRLEVLTGYLKYWDVLTVGDKITVVDCLVESIYVSQEEIKINWKI